MSGWWQAAAEAADKLIGQYQRNTSDRKAGKVAYSENVNAIRGRMEAAKEFGLHPLAVLGGNFGGSGAPLPVSTDFRGTVADIQNEATRQREWKQEQEFRRDQQHDARIAANQEQELRQAQIERIYKENSFIDEQIRASQEQRLRESARSMVSTASNPQDQAANAAAYVKNVPNEVVRNINGEAQGDNPHVEFMVDPSTGRRIPLPFGMTQNAEPGEIASFLKFVSAHYGIPMDVMTGKYFIDKYRHLWDPKDPKYEAIRQGRIRRARDLYKRAWQNLTPWVEKE